MNNLLDALIAAKLAGGGGGGGSGLTDDVKQALLNCFNHVAWTDEHGQDYVDELEAALYHIDHITAVYTQSGTVYDTDSLDSLRDDLVVTAFYQGMDSKTVTSYTLSGTLTDAVSTITVSYGGKTTTFTVDVTVTILFDWDYTEGIGNKINSVGAVSPTMAANGLLLQGGETLYSASAIAPNIEPPTESFKMDIDYTSLSADSSNGSVNFCLYNSTKKRAAIMRQTNDNTSSRHNVSRFINADNTVTNLDWALSTSGRINVEYDANANTIKFTQGANSYQATIATPTEWTQQPRVASASKGEKNSSVKIQHIRIVRVV